MKRNLQIAENLPLFTMLKNDRKTISSSPIVLKEKRSNNRFYNGDSQVVISKQKLSIVLMVEKHKYNQLKYSFQLRCVALTEQPYFRLDTDGATHRNKHMNVPLKDQQVTTPHFNTFDENGHAIAYKTSELKDKKKCAGIIKDINLGSVCFCNAANIRFNKSEYPLVELHAKQLISDTNEDPNLSVNFKF